jgi:hypothetical protein
MEIREHGHRRLTGETGREESMIHDRHRIEAGLAVLIGLIVLFAGCGQKQERELQGLVGAYYGNADLTRVRLPETLPRLDNAWGEDTGHGSSWSGRYEGFVIAPVTGDVTFYLETNQAAALEIGESKIEARGRDAVSPMDIAMRKNVRVPAALVYMHEAGGDGYCRVYWEWEGQEKTIVPEDRIVFTAEVAAKWNFVLEPDPETIDFSGFLRVPVEHVMVFDEPGRFGGWPANNGVWIWGDEIVVGLIHGYYRASELHHSVDKNKPMTSVLARSLDGGETWVLEDPDNFVGDGARPKRRTGDINFTHPDFALRCNWDRFWVSYDRCRSWTGPYLFPDFGREKLTARTDYLIDGEKACLFLMGTEEKAVQAQLQDYAFCVRTTDGGKTIEFVSWICELDLKRSVMPSTVRISQNHLVSALRRRHDVPYPDKPPLQTNWIDVYESMDNGQTWSFLSKVAHTDRGKRNGNPPSLIRLADGRLCCTYGYRSIPYGIRARISPDNGKSWGEEIHLRDDARTWDIGYTRSVQRPDGKVVTVYYYTTDEHVEQHIAATIWDPAGI